MSYADLMDFTTMGTLSPQVFHSEEIYQRELRTVFGRTWLFLTHESQLRRPGDFVTAYLGEDPVIVSRQKDHSIKAFLNVCRHRGMRVCRQDLGNSARFTCSYHGWSYTNDGALADVPLEGQNYHHRLDKAQWSLVPVTQLDTYRGMVFATWDPEAPSLREYLHNGLPLLDSLLDKYDDLELVGPMKWRLTGNWKLAAEQFASDSYHGETSHASAIQALNLAGTDPHRGRSMQITSPEGHGGSLFDAAEFRQTKRSELPDTVDFEVSTARGLTTGHATIFPNLSFLGTGTVRVWQPRGAGEMEIWSWVAVPASASPAEKRGIINNSTRNFSTSGIFETDDSENWSEIQAVSRGAMAQGVTLNYQMGFGHEDDTEDTLRDYDLKIGHSVNDIGARGFYRRWAELMDGPEISITAPAAAPLSPASRA